MNIEQIATDCMESEDSMVAGWHTLAGNNAKTAALDTLDKRTRDIMRFHEGENLLKAVFAHDPNLSTADMLKVAAEIAERANA